MNKFRQMKLTIAALAMTLIGTMSLGTMSASAASSYGEDKPLRSTNTTFFYDYTGGTKHLHTMIKASNGQSYLEYDSKCMGSMVGKTQSFHSTTVTIDGVKYDLRSYAPAGKSPVFANVIKKVKTTGTVAATKITLNRTTATIKAGSTIAVTGSIYPANATNKNLTWSSSNPSVATVKTNGNVTGVKAGTATITARCGNAVAKCVVTVTAKPSTTGTYKNVSTAYTLLNNFRLSYSNQWYWNSRNTAKVRVTGMYSLKRNTTLENVAKLRAKEAWTMYYERGQATHTRPNGSSCGTAYPVRSYGECLAWGPTSDAGAINLWAETNKSYSGQGHRRLMLTKSFRSVGIACYTRNGKTAWAMSFGY